MTETMSRNAYIMVAAAALLFATAFAVFCVSDDVFSDATDGQMPMPQTSEMRPYEAQGPLHGHEIPPMREQGPMMNEQPRYVIDAPDRPDNRPERIIDDYGRMYEEKRGLEDQGAEVFVYDPELKEDAGKELAGILNEMFGNAIVSERPQNAETIEPEQLPESYDVSFLEFMQERTGKDTWLGQLLSVMISQYVNSSSESEGVAASQGREDRYIEVPSDVIKEEEDEREPETFIDDIPKYTPSSESYLIEHGFDGGTSF